MPLHQLKDYYPNYRDTLADGQMKNIDSYSIYAQGEDRVGTAKDILVDDSGRFRYLVVDTGPWIFGKNVLLPIGLAKFDYHNDRIYVDGLSKAQVENLPEYKDGTMVDERYEERVRGSYQPIAKNRSNRQFIPANDADRMEPLEGDLRRMRPLDASGRSVEGSREASVHKNVVPNIYDREPSLYGLSEEDNQGPLRLYEERLVAHHSRAKVGEVSVGKQVKTKTAEVSEPVDKERVVIERHDVTNQPAVGTDHAFENQEVARMEVYEDQVSVDKEAFVREEVDVRKETDHETVRAREKVRREELDVKTDGNPRLNK
jgi:uncharacterized protein (TIGR02271 family)